MLPLHCECSLLCCTVNSDEDSKKPSSAGPVYAHFNVFSLQYSATSVSTYRWFIFAGIRHLGAAFDECYGVLLCVPSCQDSTSECYCEITRYRNGGSALHYSGHKTLPWFLICARI